MTRRLLVPLIALLTLAACQVEATVSIAVSDETGAGTVEVDVWLDREVVDRLDGLEQLRLDDLESAGWDIDEPVDGDDGSVTVRGQRDFADPTELRLVLDEISGPEGPYSRLGLQVDRTFARTDYRFQGVLDGSVGIDAFADPGVAAALDGSPFGLDVEELETELGVPLGSLVSLGLEVDLPGDAEGNAPDGAPLLWETTLDATDPVPVLATAETTRTETLLLVAAAAALGLLLLVLVVVWLVRARRRRRRRRTERDAEAAATAGGHGDGSTGGAEGSTDAVAAAAAAGTSEQADTPPPLELVVIGGPGVMFGVRDPVDDLVAFARAHGSTVEYPTIAEQYQAAVSGRMSSGELWAAIGAEGDPRELDEDMLGQYQLTPGLREFVVRAREQGYRVAYLGDGPTAWADHLRHSLVLGELIDPWVVSASIGARLPEPAMFEALRRMSGVEPASCLLIDDRLAVLEGAQGHGYGTAWFTPTGRAVEAPGHSIIRGFADLLSS